jgi:hypothetical protein
MLIFTTAASLKFPVLPIWDRSRQSLPLCCTHYSGRRIRARHPEGRAGQAICGLKFRPNIWKGIWKRVLEVKKIAEANAVTRKEASAFLKSAAFDENRKNYYQE